MEYTYKAVPCEQTAGKEPLTLAELSSIQAIKPAQSTGEAALVGSLSFELRDGIVYPRDMWVTQAERRQGIGSGLLRELERYAIAQNCGGIVVTALIPLEEKDAFLRFMLQNGYLLPQCMECVMDVDISSMEHSHLASLPERKSKSRLYQMDSLPPALSNDYRKRICPCVIPACTLRQVKGTLIPELSLALAGEREINAYTIFSELEGRLYLSGVYSSQKMSMELLSLLQICLKRIYQNKSRWDTLRFTVFNHSGYHLGTSLFRGSEVHKKLLYQSYKLL